MTDSLRKRIPDLKRWVVKIGSALLTDGGKGLDAAALNDWVGQIVALRQAGIDVVLVSSGSVAVGMSQLGWQERPTAIHDLQAAAAVGQMGLVQAWEQAFHQHGVKTAQVLVTHDDLSDRKRYLNARSTLLSLLKYDVVPVVNENDTVVTDEIRFGDNDTLAALVTNLVEAHVLTILTDQAGMYEADPRTNPNAAMIAEARAWDEKLLAMAADSKGRLGRGGMATKLRAARLAARSGAHTFIASGREVEVLPRLQQGQTVGTLLYADDSPITARKQWLAGHLQMRGTLTLDEGACRALSERGVSLLPVGVCGVSGDFQRGEMVSCVDRSGRQVACGLANYGAEEASRIKGSLAAQ